MTVTLMFLLVVALSAALFWLLFANRSGKNPTEAALSIQELLPVHCKHFPQIRHVLDARDQLFVEQRLPRKVGKQWRAERREIVQLYIQGLYHDFLGLQQLARLLAALSPEVNRKQEWEWLWLAVRFWLLCAVIQVRFTLHILPPQGILHLTEMLAGLGMMLEYTVKEMTQAIPRTEEAAAP